MSKTEVYTTKQYRDIFYPDKSLRTVRTYLTKGLIHSNHVAKRLAKEWLVIIIKNEKD